MSQADLVAATMDGDGDRLRQEPYDPAAPFWGAARDHHVDLLLLDQARASRNDRAWPEEARLLARRHEVDAAAMRSLRDRELARILDVLGSAGAPCLIIKGAALAHTLYPQPHVRQRDDADLLIRPGDVPRVSRLLEAQGYARAAEISGDYATSQMHFDRADCPDPRYALDVHWRIVNQHAFAEAVTFEELDAARLPVAALGPHAWTLSPPHALALACIHRVAHHRSSDDLQWLWDIRLLVSSLRAGDADRFMDLAVRSATRAVCADGLDAAARRFSMPAAAALIDGVRPRAGEPEEASAHFLGGRLSQAEMLRSDLSNLGWRHGAALLREHLFPPAAYMRSLYDQWPVVLLPAAYLHRIVSGAPKWLRRP